MPASKQILNYPLSYFFLSGYLARKPEDLTNFPNDQPDLFHRYEEIFRGALDTLNISKEALRKRPEFNFDSGDPNNLESGIGVLRAVEALRLMNFGDIAILKPPGPDIFCKKSNRSVLCEVKTITKQSRPREGYFFIEQVYEKICETIDKARGQLEVSAKTHADSVTLLISVSNWLEQAIHLKEQDYQRIVNRLERDQLEHGNLRESLQGIDGILFVTKLGGRFLFLNQRGKAIEQ